MSEILTITKFPIPDSKSHSIKELLSTINNITSNPSPGGINFGVLAKSYEIKVPL